MPEGHKTHFLARQHQQTIGGQPLSVTSPQGRFSADARKVHRKRLCEVTAAGKHMFYRFENDSIIHVHLGRYGSFRQSDVPPPPPRGKVRMRMVGEDATVDLNGPSTCRVIGSDQKDEIVARLGPDPLAGGRKTAVRDGCSTSSKPIGVLLLDQSIVAGVGNIFRAEVLFEVGIDPETPGNELTPQQFDAIWKSLVKMMKTGLRYGRIISVTAREAGKPLKDLPNNQRFRVYGKTDCPRCGRSLTGSIIASRKINHCLTCQT